MTIWERLRAFLFGGPLPDLDPPPGDTEFTITGNMTGDGDITLVSDPPGTFAAAGVMNGNGLIVMEGTIHGGGGGGSVDSVTGDLGVFVDNTDPANPVVELATISGPSLVGTAVVSGKPEALSQADALAILDIQASDIGGLAAVALTNAYSSLSGKPTIPTVTPSALTKTDDTNVTLTLGGSPTVSLLAATSIAVGWSGQLGVGRGGTGAATLTGYVQGNGTSAFSASATIPYTDISGLATVAHTGAYTDLSGLPSIPSVTPSALSKTDDTNVTITLGGSPSVSLLAATSISLGWTGTLAVSRGGTGAATLTGYLKGNGTSAVTASATIPYSDLSGTPTLLTSPLTTKGDVWGFSTVNARVPIGADGFVLTADSTAALGLKWAASTGGTPAAMTKGDDTNVTLTLTGTPSTALLQAVLLQLGWTGQLSVARGGSGVGTLTGYVKGNGTSAFSASATIPYSDLSGTPTIPATVDIQIFSTAGAATWTKPANAKMVEVYGCGSGGQGGGGQGGNAATARGGGGGGGGGAYGYRQFVASVLPSSVTVTVGAKGTGAGGGSSAGAGASPGGNGAASSFGSFFSTNGGGGGGGAASGAGGTPGLAGTSTAANSPGSTAGTPGATGGKGVATAAPATTPLDSWSSAPGGGGGAGATTGNAPQAASPGGGNGAGDTPGVAGTSSNSAPTDGGNGAHTANADWPGTGGGGGGAGLGTLAGKNGGTGIFGSGGGGGGVGSGAAGGNGGNGGDGFIVVVTYF